MTESHAALPAVLWVLLVVSLVANSVISLAALPVAAHLVSGLIAVGAIAGLVVLRQRRLR